MASRKSGLDTRLIGQALAGPRPLDVAKPVGEAIARGEVAFERLRKERKEEEEKIAQEEKERQNLQARAIAGLKDFDKSKVPAQLREAITKEAFALKKGALEIISNKNLDPITAQLEVQKYMQGINDLATKANDFKEWYKQFTDTTQDDLSKLNNSLIYRKVNDIAKGNFKYKDGMFILEGEEPMTFDDMLNIRHINRRSDTYLTLLENTKKSALAAGTKNGSLDVFKTNLEDSIDAARMTDADIASVLVDELNYSDENNEIRKQIKRDFETDGSFDDKDENGNNIREKYLGLIKEKLMKAAEERFFEGTKAYNEKLNNTPPPSPYTKSFQQEISLYGPKMTSYASFADKIANLKTTGPGNFEVRPAGEESKSKAIVNQLKTLDKQNQGNYRTREEQLEIFISNAKNTDDYKNKSNEELISIFNEANGDALVFYNSEPLKINYNDPYEVYDLILKSTPGLSSEAQEYFMNDFRKSKNTALQAARNMISNARSQK